ncbi:CPBP family intramembrane glutamic endopeptidase [Ornithinicoccus halotolerans]|uniref:CPBP family intramembrane glutamic endopeptidase n=1 Tax=Ornithinicoccus halotolerans TaxID=1748220 RepID=UPI001885FAF8|nr:CPBP family intramembrane glutamic endopeptidase [Ornithinicoccus halotolerans]
MERDEPDRSLRDGSAAGLPAATWLGLALALVVVPTYAVVVHPQLSRVGLGEQGEALVGFAVLWASACLVLVVVRRGEQASWASVGIRRTPPLWLLIAVGIGILLSLLVPALSLLAGLVLPTAAGTGGVDTVATSLPWALILLGVVTAAVTEELLFRAYPIERLLARFRSPWAAVLVPLVPFTVIHAQEWGIAHVIGVVIPLGLALSVLYLWRRNLLVVVVAHLLVDAPLVVISLGQG